MMGNDGTVSGMAVIASQHSVADTITRLESALKDKGILIFARIDFAADAARAGLSMRPEQLLIFGNPKAGTPLMQQKPTAGIDLPLKALAWEDEDRKTWLGYNAPNYLIQRHGLDSALEKNLGAVIPLFELAARA
jgi:uncharacterized protein (DUF302 family)